MNSFFGQNQPPQTPQYPQLQPQNMPPQYWAQGQGKYPPNRPQNAPVTAKPKPEKPKKRVGRLKAKKIFRITKLEIYTMVGVIIFFGWMYLSKLSKQTPSVQKAPAKAAIIYKGKAQK